MVTQPIIKDLSFIGDKRTCAIVDKQGTVVWYCPWRFDQPSALSLLIDEGGGYWSVSASGKQFIDQTFSHNAPIVKTMFEVDGGSFDITDFMPLGDSLKGVCRLFSPAPVGVVVTLLLRPDYSRQSAKLKLLKDKHTVTCKRAGLCLKSSHPLSIDKDKIIFVIPANEAAWAVLYTEAGEGVQIDAAFLNHQRSQTLNDWDNILNKLNYNGPYKAAMYQSYLAIQLVTHSYSNGILAAATTSLPEIVGSSRNYDYRYVWLRDTAMVVSALIRAQVGGTIAEDFLGFLCRGRTTNKKSRFVPFYDLDAKTAPDEDLLPGTGYKGSKPIRMGNNAFEQLQLDAQGNVLLAAKQVYGLGKGKPNWQTAKYIADYLVKNWKRKDHGIWEEHLKEHFTSSKVLVAKSLEFIAAFADNEKQRKRWLSAADDIKKFIASKCMTNDGAYAVYAGSQQVDITAALYPVWLFDDPHSAEMKKTIERIENEYKEGELYHRRLEMTDTMEEGVFLAGCLWMAQYFVMTGELSKTKKIIDAVLQFATTQGFLAEEGDIKTGQPLGNLPQTFVHASLMGVIIDYNDALQKSGIESD